MGNTIERLTIKDYGHYVPQKVCSINQYGEVDDQDTCPEYCEGVIGTCENGGCAIQECFDRLGVYEDLEEQDKLLKLPCAVGDTVYTLNPLSDGKIVIGELKADAFFCALSALEGRFGETTFLTLEEAKAALAKITN